MFQKRLLDIHRNLFFDLQDGIQFETICTGRTGAILVRADSCDHVPLVRSTTAYLNPPHRFTAHHNELMASILEHFPSATFNNALIEVYDERYKSMGMHSDQAQDLASNSYIALYSCYQDPHIPARRKLQIKNKNTKDCSDIVLDHHSVVVFSTDTNRRFTHRIYLENSKSVSNQWLGVTFRLSSTFLKFVDGKAWLTHDDSMPLKIVEDEHEKKRLIKLRSEENKCTDFTYPLLYSTLSPGDLQHPV
jgi:hypothetical protein